MGRRLIGYMKRTAVAIIASCLMVMCALPSYAIAPGVSHVIRTDTPVIEQVTIAIKTQLQYYTKFVLSNLEDVKAIQELSKVKDLYTKLTSYVDQAKDIQNKLSPETLESKIGEVTGMMSNLQTQVNKMSGIWGMFGDKTTITGLLGAITNGTGSGLYPDGDLASISDEEGFEGVAKAVVSRTSEVFDKSLKESTGNDGEKAVMEAYKYIVKSVPLVNSEVHSAYIESISNGTVFEGEAVPYYLGHLADASKTPPVGAITEILDKYLAEESPYCEAKYMDAISKDITLITESLNEATNNGDSPQSKLMSYMGTLVRANELTMRQYENMNDIQADLVKLQGINASVHSTLSSGSLRRNAENTYGAFDGMTTPMKKILWEKLGIKQHTEGK